MPYTVTQESILSLSADAAVLPLEMTGRPTEGQAAQAIAQAGGEALRSAVRSLKFLAVGSAAAVEGEGLPFAHLIVSPVPRWLTGKANELLALERCYQAIFARAEELGCRKLAMPFLSCCYYRFPKAEAIHIALREADRWVGETVFAADSRELLDLSAQPYRKARIVSYVGYYRDYAVFALDNGQFGRVDLRPELRRTDTVPYVEACFHEGVDPTQKPLPEAEIRRLRQIWDETV